MDSPRLGVLPSEELEEYQGTEGNLTNVFKMNKKEVKICGNWQRENVEDLRTQYIYGKKKKQDS